VDPAAVAVPPVALVPATASESDEPPGERPARRRRRVRPESPQNWAAATSDVAAGDAATGPAVSENGAGPEGTGWPAAPSPQTEE
jgi:hypothetical protein